MSTANPAVREPCPVDAHSLLRTAHIRVRTLRIDQHALTGASTKQGKSWLQITCALAIEEHAHEMQVLHRPRVRMSYWSCTAAHLAVAALAQTGSCATQQKPNPQTNTHTHIHTGKDCCQPCKQAAHLKSCPAQSLWCCHHLALRMAA